VIMLDLPRTNNGCESFHSHLSKSFSGPHPNIYRILFDRSSAVPNEYVHSAAEHSVSKISEETAPGKYR